jgi:hypothetical protein
MKKILALTLIVLMSCNETDNDILDVIYAERTIIVYMAADNNLSSDALCDIEEMKAGFIENGIKLVVFLDQEYQAPCVMEITRDSAKTIKIYQELNSAEAKQMRSVLSDIIQMYPSREYSLILWSHGTSWMPADVRLKAFGLDNNKQMNIQDLADALPVHFDFILFDACLMGSVEVAYELREKTDYIIASSSEIIYTGFPYTDIMPELLVLCPDLKQVAKIYYDYYEQLSDDYCSATISLINTKELNTLANVTKQLILENKTNLSSLDRISVQRLDVFQEQYAFDLYDFIDKVFYDVDKTEFVTQMNKTVLYKANTMKFLEEFDIETFSGLSTYIFHESRDDLNNYYKQLSWYKSSGYDVLFQNN